MTTYFGHRISIEPAEWGYVAEITVPGSDARLVAANTSAFRALDDAFEVIDQHRYRQSSMTQAPGRE